MASEHTTVSKLELLLGPFKLKLTRELFVMTMKNDAKFEIEVLSVQNLHEKFNKF